MYSLAVLVLLLFYFIFAAIKSGLVFILCLDSFLLLLDFLFFSSLL